MCVCVYIYIREEGNNCLGLKLQVFVLKEIILHLTIEDSLLKRFREGNMLGLKSNF